MAIRPVGGGAINLQFVFTTSLKLPSPPMGLKSYFRPLRGKVFDWVISSPSMTLTHPPFSIAPLAIALLLTSPFPPLLLPFLAPGRCYRTWVLTIYQFFYLSLSLRSLLLLLFTRPLPRDGGMADDHGAPEAEQLPRVWTRGHKETESRQRVSGANSP